MIEHPQKEERLEQRRQQGIREAEQYQATLLAEQERIDAALKARGTAALVRVRLQSKRLEIRNDLVRMYEEAGWDVATETRTLLTAPPQYETTLILS